MKKYYDATKQRLVFAGEKATSDYWDARWQSSNLKLQVERDSQHRLFVNTTRQYLSPQHNVRILEGGCGQGSVVLSLARAGYDAYGIDYATSTIEQVKELFPHLQLTTGDLSALPYPDNFFDGYWSMGVIEHYYDGYEPILSEMTRTLKRGGFAFITFPYMNFLRRWKSRIGLYPAWNNSKQLREKFYQFALAPTQVVQDMEKLGFSLSAKASADGFKGLKDEAEWLKPWFQALYQKKDPVSTAFKNAVSLATTPFAGHIVLLVFQKNG